MAGILGQNLNTLVSLNDVFIKAKFMSGKSFYEWIILFRKVYLHV